MNDETKIREAAQDIIDAVGLTNKEIINGEEVKVPIEIDANTPIEKVEKLIKDAIPILEADDPLKAETLAVIEEFKVVKVPKDIPEEAPEAVIEEDDSLETEIIDAQTLSQLKKIAKSNNEFKSIRGELSSYKMGKDLKEKMLVLLKEETETQQEVANRLHEKLEAEDIKKARGPVVSKSIKAMPTNEIVTKKPFNSLFDINETVLEAVISNMKENGYDPAFPAVLWGNIMLDGHTRLEAAEALGMKEIPVEVKEFYDEHEALEYAVHNQRNRRNLSEAELLRCITLIDAPLTFAEAGKKGSLSLSETSQAQGATAKKTAKILGIGKSKVADARIVKSDKAAVKKVVSGEKTIHAAAKEVKEQAKAKKKDTKQDKPEVPKKTRLDAVALVFKERTQSTVELIVLTEDADIVFEEWGNKTNMAATTKIVENVLEVLIAF